MNRLLIILAGLVLTSSGLAADAHPFDGRWTITEIHVVDSSSEWARDDAVPAAIEIRSARGVTETAFTTKQGVTCRWTLAMENARDGELVMFGCPPTVKDSNIISPVQRARLRKGRLEGMAVTDKVLYRWVAELRL